MARACCCCAAERRLEARPRGSEPALAEGNGFCRLSWLFSLLSWEEAGPVFSLPSRLSCEEAGPGDTLLLAVAGDGDRLLLLLPLPASPPPGEGTLSVAGPGEDSSDVISMGWVILAGTGEAARALFVTSAGGVSLMAVVSTEELVGTSAGVGTVVVMVVAMVATVVLLLVVVAGDG